MLPVTGDDFGGGCGPADSFGDFFRLPDTT